MTTPAQGNLSESSGKQPDGGFEASGLSPDEAERLAATFKPSWELDEAPFTQGNGGLDAAQIEALAAGGVSEEIPGPPDSRTVPPHAPPQRMETHEPEVSVIIDRSITSAEMEGQRSPPPAVRAVPVESPFAAPAFAQQAPLAPAMPQRIAPVLRSRSADESLELPASLKKSNKGLFIGLGVAVAAAGLVFVVHGAMSSDSAPSSNGAAAGTTTPAQVTEATPARAAIPPVPPAAIPAAPQQASSPATPAAPSPAPQRYVPAAAPRPQPHAAPPPAHHAAAPKNPPKATGGGIVRDVPF